MKVLDKVSEAEEQVLSALSTSQDRLVDGVSAARGAVAAAADRTPTLPSIELPSIELPGFGEVIDNMTDFWTTVLEHNRSFAHRLHGAVLPPAKPRKRAASKASAATRSTKSK